MSIKKNPRRQKNPWEVRWRERGRQYSRSFATKAAAEMFDAKRRDEQRTGRYIDPTRAAVTFGEMAKRWQASKRHRNSTAVRNQGILDIHLIPAFGHLPLLDITRSLISKEVKKWEANGLKRRTVDRHLAVLSGIFNMAVADDLLVKSPVRQIDRAKAERPHRLALEVEQQAALLQAARGHYEPFFYLALSTGCRISELFDLLVGDVNFSDRTLRIRNSKTEAGVRVLSLSSTDIKKIQHHLATTGRLGANPNTPLFVTPKGRKLNYSNFRNRVFCPIRKAAGLENLQVHDLRRTSATTLIKEGVAHKDVQARLGHEDIRTTLNMYAESTREGRQHVAAVMEEALSKATRASRHLNAVV